MARRKVARALEQVGERGVLRILVDQPGEQVVVNGFARVRPGARVKAVAVTAPADTAGRAPEGTP